LLVSAIFLFIANRQKSDALSQLNAAKQNAAQLQQQLDAAKTAAATTQNTDNDRLRKENIKLSQNTAELKNSLTQLRTQNEKLTQQLGTARTAVQLQQEHLQQLQTESQQTAATTEQSAEQPTTPTAQMNSCINNLRQIDGAKQQWALEYNKNDGAIPTVSDLLPYLRDNVFPVCPSGGNYNINAVAVNPTCSITGHALP
jgi:chromosome segregation ATPase